MINLAQRLRATGGSQIALPTHPKITALYTMDNISGSTLVDDSPNGNDATIVGTVPAVSGLVGNALDFPGTSGNYVDLPEAIFPTGEYFFFLWVDFDSLKTDGRVLEAGQGGSPGARNVKLILRQLTNEIQLLVADGATTFITLEATDLATTSGYHSFHIEGDDSSVEFYYDNVLKLSSTSVDTSRATADFFLGTDRNLGGTVNFNGKADQFRSGNARLTELERTTLYNAGAGV